mmetsp:Transcript_17155/g.36854  ORF Transcript_17155/g.36854 Transcript_17155/m.36854 type:complete len:185 (-) Transcript_17155:175-729(-)
MGYAGYSPGHKVADQLTPLQQALRNLPVDKAQEVLELVEKLTRNVVRNPGEEKYRTIKLTNPKIAATIAEAPGMVPIMQEMGWIQEGEALILPQAVRLAHEVHVVGLIDAKDYHKKEAENEKRRVLRADKMSDEQKELMKKMELDRKEKEAEGPVTQGSTARDLGNGPNVMRAGDIGIGKSSGG